MHHDETHVLVQAWPFRRENAFYLASSVYRVNVVTGMRNLIVSGAPAPAHRYYSDGEGRVRHATFMSEDLSSWFGAVDGSGKWTPSTAQLGANEYAMRVNVRSSVAYVVAEDENGPSVQQIDLATGEREEIARGKGVSPDQFVTDPVDGTPVAIEFEPDYPRWQILKPDRPLARVIQIAQTEFTGYHPQLISWSADGSRAVVRVYSDRTPGAYVLVDARTGTATPLFNVRSHINPADMSPMEAFNIRASDGVRIPGYLTAPPAAKNGPVPLVVYPHGGPRSRDRWGFDEVAQMFAAAGFAVLQVNFRGSSGYGVEFRHAADGRWGDRVQEDIIEATRWAIQEKVADPNRIAIFGVSFGGYSALQSAILAPDVFRCAVGYAGIYDLALLHKEGDISDTRYGRAYVRQAVGTDPDVLRRHSPRHNADRLTVPVLLVHGEEDRRAPISHAKAMCEALLQAGRPCETLYKSDEFHGFLEERNRIEAFQRILEFIEKHTAPQNAAEG